MEFLKINDLAAIKFGVSPRPVFAVAGTNISANTQFAKFAKYNSTPKFVDLQCMVCACVCVCMFVCFFVFCFFFVFTGGGHLLVVVYEYSIVRSQTSEYL